MLPAILSVAINVAFIASAIIYKNLYLTIPAGVGILFSINFICLASKIQTLKTFAENNKHLKTEVANFQQQNNILQDLTQDFQQEVDRLNRANSDHRSNLFEAEKQLSTLSGLQEEQAHLIKEQERQVQNLESALTAHKERHRQQEEHITLLTAIGRSHLQEFGAIQNSFTEQEELLRDNVTRFQEGLTDLEQLRQIKDEMINWLREARGLLSREQNFIEERRAAIRSLREEEQALSIAIAKNQESAKATNIHIQELEEIKIKLSKEVEKLQAEIEKLRVEIVNFQKETISFRMKKSFTD